MCLSGERGDTAPLKPPAMRVRLPGWDVEVRSHMTARTGIPALQSPPQSIRVSGTKQGPDPAPLIVTQMAGPRAIFTSVMSTGNEKMQMRSMAERVRSMMSVRETETDRRVGGTTVQGGRGSGIMQESMAAGQRTQTWTDAGSPTRAEAGTMTGMQAGQLKAPGIAMTGATTTIDTGTAGGAIAM